MKKLLCWLLMGAMLLTAVACGGNTETGKQKYQFTVNGITVSIDDSAEEVLASLGTWQQYSDSPSCAFEGLDKIYVYTGFRIQTYPLNGKDYVYSVELLDDSVSTPEGIAIGSSREDVIAAYGDGYEEVGASLCYAGDSVYLQILLRNGTVSNIHYLKDNPVG